MVCLHLCVVLPWLGHGCWPDTNKHHHITGNPGAGRRVGIRERPCYGPIFPFKPPARLPYLPPVILPSHVAPAAPAPSSSDLSLNPSSCCCLPPPARLPSFRPSFMPVFVSSIAMSRSPMRWRPSLRTLPPNRLHPNGAAPPLVLVLFVDSIRGLKPKDPPFRLLLTIYVSIL